MNGGTLKWAFSVIVWTQCGVMGLASVMLLFNIRGVTFDVYVQLIKELGTTAFFTMVCQSFLHGDRNHDGVPDIKQIGEKNVIDIVDKKSVEPGKPEV